MPKNMFNDSSIGFQLKGIGAGVLMALSIWLMNLAGVHWIIEAVVSTLIYCAAIFSFKVFNRSELDFIKTALNPRTVKNSIFAKKEATT